MLGESLCSNGRLPREAEARTPTFESPDGLE